MKRTQIYLDADQDEQLQRRAGAEGVTKSSLIRRAIDRYLRADDDGALLLARFHRAVEEVAGVAPYLAEGGRYVDDIRQADRERQEEIEARRRS